MILFYPISLRAPGIGFRIQDCRVGLANNRIDVVVFKEHSLLRLFGFLKSLPHTSQYRHRAVLE